jgi:hypothetical protein
MQVAKSAALGGVSNCRGNILGIHTELSEVSSSESPAVGDMISWFL